MITELRSYRLQPGGIPAWLELFRGTIVPVSARFGVAARSAWLDAERAEFHWIREYADAADRERLERAPERAAFVDQARPLLTSVEVRIVDPVRIAP